MNEVINAATNHELILEQDKAVNKNNFTPKSIVPTLVIKPTSQQPLENSGNPNKRKWNGEKKPCKCKNSGKEQFGNYLEPKYFKCGKMGHIKDCLERQKRRNSGKEHFGNCLEPPTCFNCGKMRHL